MRSFRFSLERVLEWRAVQLHLAEEKLSVLQRRLSGLQVRQNELRTAHINSELAIRSSRSLAGSELQARAAFHRRLEREMKALHQECSQAESDIAKHLERLLQVRRDHRVIEKLKEKRRQQWTYLTNREIEAAAAEAYLATWRPSSDEL